MINVLIKTLQIDMLYSVNSFLYTIKKIPIFKDLFTDDIYKSKIINNYCIKKCVCNSIPNNICSKKFCSIHFKDYYRKIFLFICTK